jgi:hypothetical protein
MLAAVLAATLILAPVLAPQPASGAVGMASGAEALTVNSSTIGFAGQEWWVVGKNVGGSASGVSSATSNTLTLLHRSGTGYGETAFSSGSVNYYNSFLNQRMESIANNASNFPAKESALIIARTLTASDGIAGNDVNNQKLWPLSYNEVVMIGNTTVQGYHDSWWTRSAVNGSNNKVWYSLAGGIIISTDDESGQRQTYPIRPALNLNLNSVLFSSDATGQTTKTSDAVGGSLTATGASSGKQKLTVTDSTRTLTISNPPSQTSVVPGDSLGFSYSGATQGSNSYVSCILKDSTGAVKYYGRLVNVTGSGQSSSTTLSIPMTGVAVRPVGAPGTVASDTMILFRV